MKRHPGNGTAIHSLDLVPIIIPGGRVKSGDVRQLVAGTGMDKSEVRALRRRSFDLYFLLSYDEPSEAVKLVHTTASR